MHRVSPSIVWLPQLPHHPEINSGGLGKKESIEQQNSAPLTSSAPALSVFLTAPPASRITLALRSVFTSTFQSGRERITAARLKESIIVLLIDWLAFYEGCQDYANDQTTGLAKVQARDHYVRGNDTGLSIDVPSGAPKHPSLSQRFENSPLDETLDVPVSESRSRCGYFGATKLPYICLLRQVGAEIIGTFILVFAGCGAAVVDAKSNGAVTHVGVSLSFGIVVMIMVYAVGHISGAHLNPSVTIAFATVRHFPWKNVPFYVGGQVAAGICAGFCLRIIFGDHAHLGATLPAGSNGQSFVLEIITGFILMFVVSAVATDTRAVGELAGIAVGSAVCLNALFAGPISGASMNPARSIGPAVAANDYRAFWVYLVGPTVGAVFGAWGYNLIRGSEPTLIELETLKTTKSIRR